MVGMIKKTSSTYDKAPPAQSETPDKSAPPTPASSTDAETSSSKTTVSHSHAASQRRLIQGIPL